MVWKTSFGSGCRNAFYVRLPLSFTLSFSKLICENDFECERPCAPVEMPIPPSIARRCRIKAKREANGTIFYLGAFFAFSATPCHAEYCDVSSSIANIRLPIHRCKIRKGIDETAQCRSPSRTLGEEKTTVTKHAPAFPMSNVYR